MGRILGILEWNNWQKPGNNKLKPTCSPPEWNSGAVA